MIARRIAFLVTCARAINSASVDEVAEEDVGDVLDVPRVVLGLPVRVEEQQQVGELPVDVPEHRHAHAVERAV